MRLKNQKYFTLLETVFAVLIFGIAMLGIFGLLVYGLRTIRHSKEKIYVNRVLETVVEEARNLSWGEIAGVAGVSGLPAEQTFIPSYTPDPAKPNVPTLGKLFGKSSNPLVITNADQSSITGATGKIYVSDVPGSVNLKRIEVEVSYLPYMTHNRRVTQSVVTYLSEKGINRR